MSSNIAASRPEAQETIAATSKRVICSFLDRVNFSFQEYKRDPELESLVKEATKSWPNETSLQPHIATATAITVTGYGHLPNVESKLQIALYTAIATSLDDPAIFDSSASHNFHPLLCAGLNQHDNMLGELTTILTQMWDHFPRFAAGSILASTMQFINVSMLENISQDQVLSPSALSFVEHRRIMSGISEAYAAFIWEKTTFPEVNVYMQALPDIMLYINYVNDILSFYKEELAEETGNYIHGRAAVTGKPVLETLSQVIDETVAANQRVYTILGDGDAKDAWERFAKGYICFHIGNARYRLLELLGDQYRLDIDMY
ncbi:terpene cyclase [Taiwanofungus camphoratus]|nr:terpene cyclase [Antrodia cinnamomea]KAI0962585.1 terpene cyclase, variant 3 [Antrodia cinnamomea]KAI0964585.1 terpene cyclase [Antrodia cinnamomea]